MTKDKSLYTATCTCYLFT